MKNISRPFTIYGCVRSVSLLAVLAVMMYGCTKSSIAGGISVTSSTYGQVNLVADASGEGANKTDGNLKNAWGLAIGASGSFWISDNYTALSSVYDTSGASLQSAISIATVGNVTGGGHPTGVVYNNTTSFNIAATGQVSQFIYATLEGTIAAWGSAGVAITVADRSLVKASYTGLTIANSAGQNYIYATDFHNGRVDVFDGTFTYMSSITFSDSTIPAGFAPFNIRNINGVLYVMYANQNTEGSQTTGAGNGYVDVFSTSGTLMSRFASQGTLNEPWAIAAAPSGFGVGTNAILVGNFGDGYINVFSQSGTYVGQLMASSNTALSITGLWDFSFPVNGQPGGNPNRLYFTAGPGGTHGLFGYIQANN